MRASGRDNATLRQAGGWLAHPVTILALVVMVVNDHYFKQTYGTWWTGKLSDAAGLVFFPALVAIVIAVVAPRLAWFRVVCVAIAAAALGFAWVKVTSTGAAAASDLLSALAGPSLLRADATDLLALPFLAIAAAIGLRPIVAPRWRVAVVLPIAVFATAGTSALDSAVPVQVTVIDGSIAVGTLGVYEDEGSPPSEWWVQTTPGNFDWVPNAESEAWQAKASQNEPAEAAECLSWDPATCYRPYEGHIGVERSDNAGGTWSVDWQIPDDERDQLEKVIWAQAEGNIDPEWLKTFDVAIVGNASDYSVYAANGLDGVSMRDSNGTWTRIAMVVPGVEWVAPIPLPSEVPYTMAYPFGLPLVVFGVGLLLALVVITTGFVLRLARRAGALGVLISGVAVGGFGAAFTLLVVATGGVVSPVGIPADWILGMSCAMFLGLGGVTVIAALGMAARGQAIWALLAAIACASVAALVTSALPQSELTSMWVGLGVAALLGLCVSDLFRWRLTRAYSQELR